MSLQSKFILNASGATFPTPASTTGTVSFAVKDSAGDAQMRDGADEVAKESAGDGKLSEDDHMRTDHDRQEDKFNLQSGAVPPQIDSGSGSFYLLCESRKIPRISLSP